MSTFVADHGVANFKHVADIRGEIWGAFGITAQPSYIFLNTDGSIQRQMGALEGDELRARLDSLLGADVG